MKNLIPYLSLIILASCGEKSSSEKAESDNILENLTYSVDTIVMDSGEEILAIAAGFFTPFAPTLDKSQLLVFEGSTGTLDLFDLEENKLLRKIPFEKEGPNGVGTYAQIIQSLSDSTFFLHGNEKIGIYDYAGSQIKNLKITPIGIDQAISENFYALYQNTKITQNQRFLTSFPGEMMNEKKQLMIMDIAKEEAKLISLPEMDISSKYRSVYLEAGGGMYVEPYQVTEHEGKLYITCGTISSIYEYDPASDSLKYLPVHHTITPNSKSGEILSTPNSGDQWWSEYRKIVGQITYQHLFWDESRDIFLRLGKKVALGETPKDPISADIFLYAYNSKMEVLGETKLEGLDESPRIYFFKDGKLYSYVNVEDELGFAVFTFDF
ncbi:DUF4221 domain-containing protein [Algoriphagus sp. AGSA1]|uniref:DUF4221 family protein n=1 Tax=Algoriphagus sp. AGSA1 TaxID=2907213 RepID=UPI001F1A8200|nr:DUF4221 family protein [Algoriphagus sp. AGSA1]MCE7055932.1 DUF4221 domain-containing protein [Algoriphagus sp. AGSA1]